MKSMVWAVFQYGVKEWTLKKSDRTRIEAFEMWCWRKILSISWQEHHTNDSILTEWSGKRVNWSCDPTNSAIALKDNG